MSIKAIIFDKDGTLMDFDSFWIPVARGTVEYILKKTDCTVDCTEEIMKEFGVNDGVTDICGALCCGTYEQIENIILNVIKRNMPKFKRDNISDIASEAFRISMDKGIVNPTCRDIKSVIKQLTDNKISVNVVTTDNKAITEKCLKSLGIYEMFDYIYTDDGNTLQKPNPYCINSYAEKSGFSKDEIIMVGDTLTDMKFAKNGGIRSIGVAKSENNKAVLSDWADFITDDISGVFDIIKEL